MEVYNSLSETLKQRPFDEKPSKQRFKLNSKQCEALASRFTVVLDKFFGFDFPKKPYWLADAPTQTSSWSSLSTTSRPWKTVSFPHSKTLFSMWSSVRKVNKSSSGVWSPDSVPGILEELTKAPQSLEELYRVIKEAENFLITCRNRDWWRAAVTLAVTAEARDVHIHDLVWCIAGLKLALHSVRNADLESQAQICRLSIANCYAQLEKIAAVNSDLVRNEEQDHEDLLSKLQKVKQNYDGRNFVRRKMTNTDEKLKLGTAKFLSQKLTPLESTSFAGRKPPPQSMQIRREDLTFPSRPRLIGSGSYGSVYEVFWLGNRVAVKVFPYNDCKDLFDAEVAILAELRCPFILQLIGWCVDVQNNSCYLVSELLETDLTKFLRKRREPLRLPVLIDTMLQISRGMEYLHSKSIMHRDLKPSNILVEPLRSCKELKEQGYGRMRLCDFGIARFKPESSQSMTSKVGTLCYMAPEVWAMSNGFGTEFEVEDLDRVKYSFEADVYSFSMTFAFSLIGQEPFEGVKAGKTLMDMLRRGVRPALPSTCPKFLKELIQKCWSQNPSSRPSFPSISMTLRHLKLLLMGLGSPERRLKSLLDHQVFLSTPALSYHDISEATNGFTRRAQNISVDNVYHGVLSDRTPVLVHLKQGLVDYGNYWADVSQMLNLRHGNIVEVHAVCVHHNQCWLLYKHAGVRRSLDTWVENPLDKILSPLDEEACFRVAVGVANGLQYLHSENIHFSVTSKNILLNERFEPQILINILVCEEKDALADHQRRSDVFHFRQLISKLLLHLSSNRSRLKNTLQYYSPASSLKGVERFCQENSDVTMDEVVGILEAHRSDVPDNLDVNIYNEHMIDCREAEYTSSDNLSDF